MFVDSLKKILFTACNRTYYGDVGKTYEFELHRPKPDKLPFICFIKLVAPGHRLGDLIQVRMFDEYF